MLTYGAAASVLVGCGIGALSYVLFRHGRAAAGVDRDRVRVPHLRSRFDKAVQESRLFAATAIFLPVATPIARALSTESIRDHFSKEAVRAGWPGGLEAEELLGTGLAVGAFLAIILTVPLIAAFGAAGALGLVGLPIGPLLVSVSISRMGDARQHRIVRVMPYVLDLLVLTTRSGVSLLIAMRRVAIDYADHPIGEEFERTLSEIDFGMTRSAALDGLAARVAVPGVRDFVDNVQQAEELGRPLADTLQRLSDRIRGQRVHEAENIAGRASVLVLLPSSLIFMAVLLLLFSPFIIRWFTGAYRM